MKELKITTFNAEWMNNLFQTQTLAFWQGKSLINANGRKPNNVQKVCEKIAGLIKDIDPDIIGIQEGPNSIKEMELFVSEYLDDEYVAYNMPSGVQTVFGLVKKDLRIQVKQLPKTHKIYEYLNKKIEYYSWGEVKAVTFDKIPRKPVVLEITHPNGKKIEIFIFHTKSKFTLGFSKRKWEERDEEKVKLALAQRQRLSAELYAIRRYVTHAILSKRVEGVIIMGDLNDGPHRDVFEEKFLINNLIDELRGGFHREPALLHHALSYDKIVDKKYAYTAQFKDPTQDNKTVKVLLDHILVSDSFLKQDSAFQLQTETTRIEHQVYQSYIDNNGEKGDERPSDHIPVTTTLKLTGGPS